MMNILYNIILSPITQIIEIAYRVFDKMFSNTGVAILGVSLTVTLLCLPLYIVAESWQEIERQKQLNMKGGIARIKNFFKGDEQYMILSTYYRQNHYHPIMALRSSFGILIQIPFFLAAYHTLSSLPDLQGHSFLFIKDMGQPDAIFSINGFNINILPITMTLINCISGAIYSKGHELREKLQIYISALVFLILLYNSPAGLVIYWTMNNLFSLVKNVFYKMKEPLKVFYICICVVLISLAAYIMFGYGGGAGLAKRVPASLFLLVWIPIPLYLKGINFVIENHFRSIYKNPKLRTQVFLFSAAGLTLLNGLVLPSQLISTSVQEFCNIAGSPNSFLSSSFWMSFGLLVFWSGCIYFLFKEKLQTILSFLFASFFVGAIVNAFVFTGNYGSMDSTLKFIDGFANQGSTFILLNVVSVFVVLALIFLTIKLNFAKYFNTLCLAVISAFVVITVVNTAKIKTEYNEFVSVHGSNEDTTQSVKFHLSKTEKNILVFMLDRFESQFVPQILKDQPKLKENFSGFVFYPNTLSFNGHTLMGSPGVYGGYEYTPYEMNKRSDQKLKVKHNEAISLLPKILSEQADFDCVMSDTSWANYSYIADMSFADNNSHLNLNDEKVKRISLLSKYSGDFKKEKLDPSYEKFTLEHVINRNLFWVSLFREVPAAVRPVVYYKGTWWENGVKESSSSFADWFSCLYYFPQMTAIDSEKPTLSMITNEATHSNEDISMYDIQPEEGFGINDNAYKINSVTLKQIGEIVTYLKSNGIYDNSKIIIVSDHGIGMKNLMFNTPYIDDYNKDRLNPVLLVKDFNSNEEFTTNDSFMSNADVPSIVLKDIIENPVNPFTGKSLNVDYKSNGLIVTSGDIFMPYHSKSEYSFTLPEDSWYNVKNNIFADENWSKLSN